MESGANRRIVGPNPVTDANATGQDHALRSRSPNPVRKATKGANPLRKRCPGLATWAHTTPTMRRTTGTAAGTYQGQEGGHSVDRSRTARTAIARTAIAMSRSSHG